MYCLVLTMLVLYSFSEGGISGKHGYQPMNNVGSLPLNVMLIVIGNTMRTMTMTTMIMMMTTTVMMLIIIILFLVVAEE